MPHLPALTHEIAYLLLIFGLMVVPRMLQRFRLPAPLTSFALGMAAVIFFGSYSEDSTLSLMATLGISSLFLFAGLEIDLEDFERGKWPLIGHLAVRCIAMALTVFLFVHYLQFSWQVATLLALAILTPSTGFILDTLPMLNIDDNERYWVRMKAVSGELFALVVLFLVLQSDSMSTLAWSSAALIGMIIGLPILFIGLGRLVSEHAHGSEFSMLLMVGVIAAFLTYKLGVYYLVGAFLAGFIARLLRRRMPLLASDENLHAIKMFASFFVPFYFFYKGMSVPSGAFTLQSLSIGLTLTLVVLPARIGTVWLERRFIRGETAMGSLRVAASLTPTLIFTLVLAGILRERFNIDEAIFGALLIYAAITTMLPALMLAKPVDYDLLHEPDALPEVQPPERS